MQEYMHLINKEELQDIEWIRDDGSEIEVPNTVYDEWRDIGLSNTTFAEIMLPDVVKGN